MSQGNNLNQEDLKFVDNLTKEKEASIIFDYSTEGLQNTLNTLIKINLVSFNNQVEKANFYKK